jgi:hypothetical protein
MGVRKFHVPWWLVVWKPLCKLVCFACTSEQSTREPVWQLSCEEGGREPPRTPTERRAAVREAGPCIEGIEWTQA